MCRGGIDAFVAAGKLSAKGAAAVVGGKTVIQVSEGWRKGLSSDAKGERNPTTVRVGTVFFLSGRRCRFFHTQGGLNTKTTAALHFGNTGNYGTCRDSDGSQ